MSEPLLGKYRILGPLASGGMGEVLLARYEGPAGVAKRVVIKRVLPHLSRDEAFVRLFLREARLAAMLSHPNIVQLFELGQENDTYFLVMEYVHGRTLRHVLRALHDRGRLMTPVLSARICAQLLAGLDHAHQLKDERGEPTPVVHQDVSPENILIGYDGSVKILDFGIAEAANLTTAPRVIRGKAGYLAPERLTGARADPRGDIYAAGVVLDELLRGRAPDEGPPNAPYLAEVPAALIKVVSMATHADRSLRYARAGDMVEALEDAIVQEAQRSHAGRLADLMNDLFPVEERQTLPADTSNPVQTPVATTLPVTSALQELTVVARPSRETGGSTITVKNVPVVWLGGGVLVGLLVVLGVWLAPPPRNATGPAVITPAAPNPIAAAPGPSAPAEAPLPPIAPAPPPPAAAVPESPAALPAEVPTRKPASAAAHGTISFRVRPYADVFLGKKKLGTTPFGSVELPVGTYVFTLVNAELGVRKPAKATVSAGVETQVREDLIAR